MRSHAYEQIYGVNGEIAASPRENVTPLQRSSGAPARHELDVRTFQVRQSFFTDLQGSDTNALSKWRESYWIGVN